jgi:hypothetical protein
VRGLDSTLARGQLGRLVGRARGRLDRLDGRAWVRLSRLVGRGERAGAPEWSR